VGDSFFELEMIPLRGEDSRHGVSSEITDGFFG
jgi:hypothetical protein